MTEILSTLLIGLVSALVPVINIEAYLALGANEFDTPDLVLAGAATVGQVLGKLVWYQAGASSTRFPWVSRKLEQPKWDQRLTKWRERTAGRPWFTALVLFVSAFTGFPPFAIMSALAGVLKVHLLVFLATGLSGRLLRFLVVIGTADAAVSFFA